MIATRHWLPVIALGSAIAYAACGSSSTAESSTTTTTATGGERQGTAQQTSNMPDDAGASQTADAGTPMAAIAVVAGTATPVPANLHPTVRITAPRDNTVVRTNRVEVRLAVTDWPAPQDGRHVHLILDNMPYQRIDDPSRPIPLENLTEGTHVLRAFPGWSTHESVKMPGAFAIAVFHIGRRSEPFDFNRTAPLLTYSRPKGDYNGQAGDHILLDFYVSNIPGNALSATGHRVRYTINGNTTGEITSWVPHFIDHLPDGARTITLDLLGPDGQPVPGMYNHTERTINVNRAAPSADEHTHGGTPAVDAGGMSGDAAMAH